MHRTVLGAFWAAVLLLIFTSPLLAQLRATPPSSALLHELRKIQDVSSALYVAAHPDDENTRLIAHLANAELAETAYLSLTRGDGGQNLVGTDIREGLGVIRTQELLAARRIDGGTQFFSRANDFGYSKHPDETLNFWDRDSILNDMVWVIRKWQPDIIVTRFDPNSAGRTHGHHTTSAMLAVEAFDLAADETAYPEHFQHEGVTPWRAKRILFNTSWWFYGSREAFAAADKSDLFTVEAGQYYPLLGLSNGELAGKSRSSHASQGFGSNSSRNAQTEYLQFLDGEDAQDHTDVFAGVNDTWSRIEGGRVVKQVLAKAEADFDPLNPSAIAPTLMHAHRLITQLPPNRYTRTKLPALRQLIADCLGLYAEVVATDSLATPGETLGVRYEITARDGKALTLESLQLGNRTLTINQPLAHGEPVKGDTSVVVGAGSSNPYWLEGKATLGMYSAPGYELRGAGENPPALQATARLQFDGQTLELQTPIVYKRTYPDKGEVYRPLLVVPAAGLHFTEPVYLWPTQDAREVVLEVTSYDGAQQGAVSLTLPDGWSAKPKTVAVNLAGTGSQQLVRFTVKPGTETAEGTLAAQFDVGNASYNRDVNILRYPHIPQQAIIGQAAAKAVQLSLTRAGERIGYVMGAGDVVPKALREVGYAVDLLHEKDLASGDLSGYDAIVLGVRAYNTQDWLPRVNDKLLAYAKAGGTVVVQYNTSRRLDMAKYAPFPLKLSRKRVTVEEAPITFVAPEAAVLNRPNKLGPADFDGWVQERGLYFPEEWDEAYQPILESNDPGEEPLQGGLLVAEYGEGHYVYTGLSFFRELPAGVPGAYRLFVNLLEL